MSSLIENYIYLSLILLFIFFLFHYLFSWKIRKIVMRNFAKKLGLTDNKYKYSIQLKGAIEDKNITVDETLDHISAGGDLKYNRKVLNIFIDGKNIFRSADGIFFLPFPSKIKKIINDYIKQNIIPKNKKDDLKILGIISFIWIALIVVFTLVSY